MKLVIDGREAIAQPGQSLMDIINQLGLISGKLSATFRFAKRMRQGRTPTPAELWLPPAETLN